MHRTSYRARFGPPLPKLTNSDLVGPTDYESQKAYGYYMGLRSGPTFIARSSPFYWEHPLGPGSWPKRRNLTHVGEYVLGAIWEDEIAQKVHALLDTMCVNWTSTDGLRVGYQDDLQF